MRIMLFKKSLAIAFLFLFYSNVKAQNFELGIVSKAELEEKFHPTDTSAVAAILYKKAKTYFVYRRDEGFVIHHSYQIRIKIYKKEGFKWANFQMKYYGGNEDSENKSFTFWDCFTYNLEDGVVVATKLKDEGSFKTNINNYYKEASVVMPNVKVGSVIEINYTLKTNKIGEFPVFNFQYDIPVNYAEYFTDIPEVYIFKPILKGYFKVTSESKTVDEKESFAYKYNKNCGYIFKYQQSTYKAENIPSLKDEIFVDNISNYRSSIQHELERTRMPERTIMDYSKTWEGVSKTIFELDDFGKELNKLKYFEQDLTKITENVSADADKLAVIFKFVQNKMNWNESYDIVVDKGVKKAYNDGTGNVAEINFILIAMLNSAGIKTDPVLISTVENGVPVYPNRTVFNAVIAAAQVDGKQILLDATSKYSQANILPLEDLNWTGRLIKKDGTSQEINLVPQKITVGNTNLMAVIDNFGKITGKARNIKTDFDAYSFREKNEGINNEIYLEKLESNLNGIQINDYLIDNVKELSKPIIENFTFVSNKDCEIIGGKMYINPLLFFTQNTNPFVQEKRQMPIYFGYPKQNKYNISIEIPEGYAIESMPKPLKISTGENVGLFTFNIISEGNKIQVQVTREINTVLVSADFYPVLKSFYQQMIDKQNEKIVLKKI